MKYLLSLFLIVSLTIPKNAHAIFWTALAYHQMEQNRREAEEYIRKQVLLGVAGVTVAGGIVLVNHIAKKKGISIKDALKPISLCRKIFKKKNDTNNQAIKE